MPSRATRTSEEQRHARGRLESTWIRIGNVRMFGRISANKVPVNAPKIVLVHGEGMSSRYMVPTALQLAPYYHVYMPDLPGFGKSGNPRHILNMAGLADVLAEWMQAMSIESAVLVGNSMGCQIIVELALRHPELISHTILQGPTVDPKAPSIIAQFLRLLRDLPREPLRFLFIAFEDYLKCGIVRSIRIFEYAIDQHIEEKLPYVDIPVLVVRGYHDPIAPQRWAEEVARLLPSGKLVVIPGAGHCVNYKAPVEFMRAIRQFLESSNVETDMDR
jgi:2-hydroxy-6-oxonona-2,4-dienedioate hydrolase